MISDIINSIVVQTDKFTKNFSRADVYDFVNCVTGPKLNKWMTSKQNTDLVYSVIERSIDSLIEDVSRMPSDLSPLDFPFKLKGSLIRLRSAISDPFRNNFAPALNDRMQAFNY